MKESATAAAWFSTFFEKAFVKRLNRRIDIRIVRFSLHVGRGDVFFGSGAPVTTSALQPGHAARLYRFSGFASSP
jgi:hypothetical protein